METTLRDLQYENKISFEVVARLCDWLKAQRLENYGYNWLDFRRMSGRKSRLMTRLKKRTAQQLIDNLNQPRRRFGIFERVEIGFNENGSIKRIGYCVGQSFNEELITVIKCLIDPIEKLER